MKRKRRLVLGVLAVLTLGTAIWLSGCTYDPPCGGPSTMQDYCENNP